MCGNENDDSANTCTNCGTNLGYRNQVLFEMLTRVDEVLKQADIITEDVKTIKGWVTFFGIIVLISLILGAVPIFGLLMSLQ